MSLVLVLGRFCSFWVNLGFILGCFGIFGLCWLVLARSGSVWVSFWVALACFGSFLFIVGQFGSHFGCLWLSFWVVLGQFASHFGSFWLYLALV